MGKNSKGCTMRIKSKDMGSIMTRMGCPFIRVNGRLISRSGRASSLKEQTAIKLLFIGLNRGLIYDQLLIN
jgi:hypothetical protein